VAPRHTQQVKLYWHCWNLASEVLDTLSQALRNAGSRALVQG
jgi:LysR family transcriptional regulator (chromosome initiation inhibitor)